MLHQALRTSETPAHSVKVNHNIMELVAPLRLLFTIDWMHITWRLRVQLLHPSLVFCIGPLLASATQLRTLSRQPEHKSSMRLTTVDLDYHAKQEHKSALK